MSNKYRRISSAAAIDGQRLTCPHCGASVLIQRGRFVNHGPAGGLFRCPLSGTVPPKAVVK